MKNSIKKKLIILSIVGIVSVVSAAVTFAAPEVRPMPGTSQSNTVTSSGTSASDETDASNYKATDNSSDSSSDSSSQSNIKREVPTPIPVEGNGQVSIVNDSEKAADEKKSVSVGTMIGWLLVSIIINAAISFWIGNRFYRLSKKDTHITSELRALRRDVEEKFLQSVGGFTEQATDIENSNENYSMNEEGITMTRRQREKQPSSPEEDEMLKKWEDRMNSRQQSRTSARREESSFESNRRRKYQPTREEIEPDIEDYDEDEDVSESRSGIKSKAKGILNDIFPFKED